MRADPIDGHLGESPPAAAPSGLPRVVREIARGGLAGLLTGIVIGGGGGRLAMRVSSLIDPSARGFTTEAGAVVGQFTLEGTIGLVLFGGIFTGIGLAMIWVLVQRWLPERVGARYAAAAVIGVAMGGRFAIDGRNFDFLLLDPPLGQASIFAFLAALAGAGVVAVDQWLERRLPPPAGGALVGYSAVTLLGILLVTPGISLYFRATDCACVSPPRLPGIGLVIVGLITLGAWVGDVRGAATSYRAKALGRSVVTGLVVAGLLHLGGEVAHFV